MDINPPCSSSQARGDISIDGNSNTETQQQDTGKATTKGSQGAEQQGTSKENKSRSSSSSSSSQRVTVVDALLASTARFSETQLENSSKVTRGSLLYAMRIWKASGQRSKVRVHVSP